MQLTDIDNEIWDRLSKGDRLTQPQENLIIGRLKCGNLQETDRIVTYLRDNSQNLRDRSYDELAKVIEGLKLFYITDANTHLESAIVHDWEAVKTGAQANRIENATKQAMQQVNKALSIPPPAPMPTMPSVNAVKIRDLPMKVPNMKIFV